MARQVARQFCRLREVHSLVYGRRASGENGRKLTASTRVGSESRLMDYLGLIMSGQSAALQAVGNMTQRDSTVIVQHAGDWKVHDVLH